MKNTWKGFLAGAIVSGIIGGSIAKADDTKPADPQTAPPAAEADKDHCGTKDHCKKDGDTKAAHPKKDKKKKAK